MRRFLPVLFTFFLVVTMIGAYTAPVLAQWGPLVPCGGSTQVECTICHILLLAQNVLNFLVAFSVLVAALMFLNAGILYVLSPTNTANIAKAHGLFTSTLIGLVIILAAWLIVDLIMNGLSRSPAWERILECLVL